MGVFWYYSCAFEGGYGVSGTTCWFYWCFFGKWGSRRKIMMGGPESVFLDKPSIFHQKLRPKGPDHVFILMIHSGVWCPHLSKTYWYNTWILLNLWGYEVIILNLSNIYYHAFMSWWGMMECNLHISNIL